MSSPALNDRSEHILKLLIERYIEDGQPVGSKALASDTQLALSPATVRNVLSDLEARGYLMSPHTSAGRIPTESGYRLFVDNLITMSKLEERSIRLLEDELCRSKDASGLAASASKILSDLTQLTGIVMVPRASHETLRHLEFLPLNSKQVLVIMVVNEKEVQNFVIDTDREYSEIELSQATNYINQIFGGNSISAIRNDLIKAMEKEKDTMTSLMDAAISMSAKAFESSKREDDFVVQGESNLLSSPADTDLGRLKTLFDAFSQKKDIIDLLDRCSGSKGMQIFIGKESGYGMFDDLSLITAPYSVNEEVIGVLAVVGPTRIPYQKVIPTVDITAKILGSVLNQSS